jgi:hypothetical protein
MDLVKSEVEVLKTVYDGALNQSIQWCSLKPQGPVLVGSIFFAWFHVVCETPPGVVSHYSINVSMWVVA